MKLFALTMALALPALAAQEVHPGKIQGNTAAPLRIEIFSDFECPHCKSLHDEILPQLIRDYANTGKAYIVPREFPLQGHRYSREAASYAVAAARVGKYPAVASALFRNNASWGTTGKVWETVAAVLSPAEQAKVQALAKDAAVQKEIQYDVNYGMGAGLDRTPTVILTRGARRQPVTGSILLRYELLKSLIDDYLK